MVTNNTGADQASAWDFRGLSTDSKPSNNQIPNGSSFLEMDTGNVYFWDAENNQWRVV